MIVFGICTFPFTLRPANYRTYRIPRRNIRGGICTYGSSGPLSFREFRFISAPSTSLKINIGNVHIFIIWVSDAIYCMKHESQIVEGEQTITSKAAGHIYIHLRHDVQLTISLSKQLDSTYFCLNRKYTGCKAVQSYFYGM